MTQNKVLLLGTDTPIGLSIVRELGAEGVGIYGLGSKENSLASFSKYLLKSFVRSQSTVNLIDQIKSICSECSIEYVLAISENDIEVLNRHRGELHGIKLLIPQAEAMGKVLNKDYIYQEASKLDIQVPVTVCISDLAELETAESTRDLQFPVVLKWANPQRVNPILESLDIPFIKADYAYSMQQLSAKLSIYRDVGELPLIQTYCPGVGLGHFFFIHQGAVIQSFQHQRIHEWPPEGGVSTWCRALPLSFNQDLQNKSVALLLAIGWEGVAMVEYRYDEKSDRALLMEVNGRFWGSFPLAYHCGAKFAWLQYSYLGLGERVLVSPPRDDLQARYMIPETKRLFRVIGQKSLIVDKLFKPEPLRDVINFLTAFLNPKMRYFVFSVKDPRPFFADAIQAMRKLF